MNIVKKIKENSYLGALTILVASVCWFIPEKKDKAPIIVENTTHKLPYVRYLNASPIDVSHDAVAWGVTSPIQYSKIMTEIDGRVAHIFISQGDIMEKGQIILSLDTTKLKKDKFYYEQLVKENKKKYSAYLSLKKLNSVSEIELIETKTAYDGALSNLENTINEIRKSTIIAPFDGVVSNMSIVEGDLISKNELIAEISDTSRIKVKVNLPEQYINKVKKGQKATITIGHDNKIEGEVSYVSRLANSSNHMFASEIISNESSDLYSGGSAKAEIVLDSSKGYKIKTSSLTLNKNQVMGIKTISPDNKIIFNEIEVAKTIDSEIIVLGPTGDLKLVTTGGEWVSHGEAVTPIEEK